MRAIRWTDSAILGLAALSEKDRAALFARLNLIAEFPAMYPSRQRGRFSGLRFFLVEKRWLVYYGPEDDQIVVLAIVPALARPK